MRATRRASAWLVLTLAAGFPAPAAEPAPQQARLALHRELPRDPLLVLASSVEDPARALEPLGQLLGSFGTGIEADSLTGELGRLEGEAGVPLHQALLGRLGPELALVVDFPPLDAVFHGAEAQGGNLLGALLGRVGFVARVRDRQGLERDLARLVTAIEASATRLDDGLTRVRLPIAIESGDGAEASTGLALDFYWAIREGKLVVGLSPAWVHAAFARRPEGQRLIDGADWQRVFAHLDGEPTGLIYLNLPKLRELLADSEIVRAALADSAGELLSTLTSHELTDVGIGATTVRLPGGTRTTSFGPNWMTGGAMASGLLAAVATPRLLRTADRSKVDQTVDDLGAIAAACERFSGDAEAYPGPTEGWVPVERIAAFLEPVYIASLPRNDAWQNPILYWSNGGAYRLISTGKDGKMDRDWSGDVGREPDSDSASDIVFGEGRLIAAPE